MKEPTQKPSSRLSTAKVCARWIFGVLLAAALLLGAGWGFLNGWIVPRIDQWRPWLEQKAGTALGLPVSVGALQAQRRGGLLPALVLRDVVVREPGAARQPGLRQDAGLPAIAPAPGEALRVGRIDLTLSLRRLLLQRGIVRLELDQPELTLRRTADGRILALGHDLRQPREKDDPAGRDWVFSQPEIVLRDGTVHWIDALRPADGAPLTLRAVDLRLRNHGPRHDLDLAATPPADWGERLRATGRFVEGADARGPGDWHAWDGRAEVAAPRIDLAPLRRHLAPAEVGGLDIARGRGALQLQAELRHGALEQGTADIAVDDLDARLADGLERLALPRLRGRLTGSHAADGSFSFATQGLDFALGGRAPAQWPGGNVALRQTAPAPGAEEGGRLQADRLDLGMLASLGRSLPFDPAVRRQLLAHAPRGRVESLAAHWRGPVARPSTYQVAGRVTGLAVAGVPRTGEDAYFLTSTGRKRPRAGTPGIEGAALDFDFDQSQGSARLAIEQGALDFPGVFEEPRLPMRRLSAAARWRVQGSHIEVEVPDLRFANADTQGRASFRWQTADAQEGRPDVEGEAHPGRFPGVLDLRGSLGETAGDRVWRYLPTAIPDSARHYVRDAVLAGRATGVDFQVKGDLHHMPFAHPGEGDFHIVAQLRDVTFDFAPQSVLRRAAAEHPERRRRSGGAGAPPAGEDGPHPWPVLVGLSGTLRFDGGAMEVRDAHGALAARRVGLDEAEGDDAAEPLPVDRASARIPDLQHPVVEVRAAAHGDAGRMLGIVRASPLGAMVGGSLDRATAQGPAALDLALDLPIGRLHAAAVRGRVALDRVDLRVTPDTPLLADTRGAVDFTAHGFTAEGVRTRMLGGESRVDGSMRGGGTPAPVVEFTARGRVTAEGLRAERELGFLSRLAARAQGGTDYEAGLAVRYGQPELRIASSLRGLALDLPAPMRKAADDRLALYYRNRLVDASLPSAAMVAAHAAQARGTHAEGGRYPGLRDRLQVQLGDIAAIDYERDLSGPQAAALRGTIGVGLDPGEVLPLPEDGVMAQVRLADVDLDAWEQVIGEATAAPVRVTAPRRAPQPAAAGTGASGADAAPGLSASQTYLPDIIAVQADSLTLYGRTVREVVVGGSREGATWRANLLARELNGYLEYRQPAGDGDAGRVFARLERLDLPQATAREVGSLLDKQPVAARAMPALDIAIDDFAFNGRPVGQIALAGGPPGARDDGHATATAANAASASSTDVASLWSADPDDRLLDEENYPQMAGGGPGDDTVLPPPAPGDVLWRLQRLRVRMPEALLLASGDWLQRDGGADGEAAPRRQQASVQVRLDLQDGGRTLERLGLGDRLLGEGTGRLQGRLAWDAGLLSPDRASLRGRLRVDARDGDLRAVPVGTAKWLGLVNLRSLPRRLRGDFRDLTSRGFFFDALRGDVAVADGVARTDNLLMQGVIARVEAAGSADLVRETQDLDVLIRPEVDAGLVSLLVAAVDPAWGLGTLGAQLLLREPVSRMLDRRMRVTGRWSAPEVETLARGRAAGASASAARAAAPAVLARSPRAPGPGADGAAGAPVGVASAAPVPSLPGVHP
ncbi:MAG: DUF3971 domain-containing protein [Xylophilus ampelinus]